LTGWTVIQFGQKKALIGGNQKSAKSASRSGLYSLDTLLIMPEDSGFVQIDDVKSYQQRHEGHFRHFFQVLPVSAKALTEHDQI